MEAEVKTWLRRILQACPRNAWKTSKKQIPVTSKQLINLHFSLQKWVSWTILHKINVTLGFFQSCQNPMILSPVSWIRTIRFTSLLIKKYLLSNFIITSEFDEDLFIVVYCILLFYVFNPHYIYFTYMELWFRKTTVRFSLHLNRIWSSAPVTIK